MQEETVNEIESPAYTQVEAFPDDLQTTMVPCPNCKEMVPTSLYCLNCGYLFERAQMVLHYGVSLICRNEEDNIGDTIDSLFNQSIKPVKVIVVDDGSTDGTLEILEKKSIQYPTLYYTSVDAPRLNFKGFNISWAIRKSIKTLIEKCDTPYILRMDSDVVLDNPDLVKTLLINMENNPRLGITGAVSDKGRYMPRHVTDAVRMYRKECLDQVTGSFSDEFYPIAHGHDSIMIFRARWLGWEIWPTNVTYQDERPYRRGPKQWFALGMFRHLNGYPFSYVVLSTLFYFKETPYVIGSLIAFFTYLVGFLFPLKQYEPEFRSFMKEDLNETVIIRLRKIRRIFKWM